MAFNEYRKPLTAAQRRAAKLNGGKPVIDASKLCGECLQQLMARRSINDPRAGSGHMEAAKTIIAGYSWCSTCADVLGCTSADQIDYRPQP